MTSGVDWSLLDRQHHLGANGICSCGLVECPIGRTVQRERRAQEDTLLSVEPTRAPFVSVLWEWR